MTPSQHSNAWQKILNTPMHNPTHRETTDNLFNMWRAKISAPYTNTIGRRHAKGMGKHTGSVLKSSFVRSQVNIERVFLKRK